MTPLEQAAWTIGTGIVCGVSCALLGCYLVLRRMSLLGDAISHGILPGIVLAFIVSGRASGWPILAGALLLGFLTAFLTQAVHSLARVPEDSSMGVVFTSLFALGVILIENFGRRAHLDLDCVFYGSLETVSTRTVDWLGLEVPAALSTLVPVLLLTLAFVLVFWKELKIASFDPALATAMGLSAALVHYLLMGMVALVTVASLESVGILVVALLIVPAATAQLLADRLAVMLLLASLSAAISAAAGYWLDRYGTTMAGMMAVVSGGQFLLAVFLAPRHGLLSKLIRNRGLALRIECEDLLGLLYRQQESGSTETARAGWLPLLALRWRGLVQRDDAGALALTEAGRSRAESLVRAHRLWETYLGEKLDLPLDHLHEPAHRMEHYLDPALQNELASQLGQPGLDPHGKAIPPM